MPLELHDADARLTLSSTRVQAETAWCRAAIPLSLGMDEVVRFAHGLRSLHDEGSGAFLWSNEAGEVRIEIVMAKRGEVHWSVRLQAPPDYLHELRMVFVGRQEGLVRLADSL